LNIKTIPHPQPYTINFLNHRWDICISKQCHLHYIIKPFKYEVFYYVSPVEVCVVLLGKPYMWKNHVFHEFRPHSPIITWGHQLYRVTEVVPTIVVSFIFVKHCIKVVFQTWIFVLFMARSIGEQKFTATAKTFAWDLTTQQK
jgi:hypothetical protein